MSDPGGVESTPEPGPDGPSYGGGTETAASRGGARHRSPAPAQLRIGSELLVAVLVIALGAAVGIVAGLVWAAVAPHIPVAAQLAGRETANKALVGQDLAFAAVAATAGVVVVALVLAAGGLRDRRGRDLVRGPGAVLGLAIGGLVGAFVADLVGKARRDPGFVSALHRLAPHLPASVQPVYSSAYAFQLRTLGLVVVWPIVAVLVHAIVVRLSSTD